MAYDTSDPIYNQLLTGADGGGYLAQHGLNSKSLINLLLGYGDASSAFAVDPTTGKSLAGNYGFDQNATAAAATNPYSVQKQLAQQLSGNQYGITNNANAHGALYSGAHAAAQQHEIQNAGQRNYNAQQQLASQIAGINQSDTNSLITGYGTLAQNALNDPTIPATPQVTPPGLPAPAPVGSTPATQNWNTNPSGFNAGAPQNSNLVAIKPPKLPKLSTPVGIHAQ